MPPRNDDRPPVPDRVTDAVLQASRAMVAVVARSLPHGEDGDEVTMIQFRALVVLRATPDANLARLAYALGVTASTATRMCDRLVERGWVRRTTADENRREIRLALTPLGLRLVDRVTRARRRDLERVLAEMPQHDRDRLVPALEAFTDATARTLGLTWPGADAGTTVGTTVGTDASVQG